MSRNDDMVPLNVEVPRSLREECDELAEALHYGTRAAFIRAILRDTVEPVLTPGAKTGISKGYGDVAAGRTMSIAAARDRLSIVDKDDNSIQYRFQPDNL